MIGKLIVSGEYNVLWGGPALTLPLPMFRIETEVIEGDAPPEDPLAHHAVQHFCTHFQVPFCSIAIRSTLPIGAGLGSSSALILSIFHALAQHYGIAWEASTMLPLAIATEHFQHGTSSGLDLKTCWHQKSLYVRNQDIEELPPLPFAFHLCYTGRPTSTTRACVQHVASAYEHLSAAFTEATEMVLYGWRHEKEELFWEGIVRNQRLLERIGVVPPALANVLGEYGILAKICGAGTLDGNAAGVLLCARKYDALRGIRGIVWLSSYPGNTSAPADDSHHPSREHG